MVVGQHPRGERLAWRGIGKEYGLLAVEIADSDGGDLQRGFGNAGYAQNAASGWVLGKVISEDIVEFAIVFGVLEIDLDVDNVIHGETGRFDHFLYVVERLAYLIREIRWSGAIGAVRALP